VKEAMDNKKNRGASNFKILDLILSQRRDEIDRKLDCNGGGSARRQGRY
jgi:hypothetical protein